MTYFTQTDKLLSEPTFITFAQEAYHDFIRLDIDDCIRRESNGETYTFNTTRWLSLAKKDEPRFFSGGSGSFILYMRYEVERVIHEDWEKFKATLPDKQKDQQPKIANFLAEAEEVGRVSKNRQHLEPLLDTIERAIDSIVVEYGEMALNSTNANKVIFENTEILPLQWNGGSAVLIELFRDLLDARTTDGKRYINNPPILQLVQFIHANFVDENGTHIDKGTLKKYLYDREKSVVKKIELTFPEGSKTIRRKRQND